MGIFGYRWGFLGLAGNAMDLWEEGTAEALRAYEERESIAAKERVRSARTDWLERNRAERSFPCGVVPDPAPAAGEPQRPQPRLNVVRHRPVQVIAAVLPSDVAFLREVGDPPELVEVGRIPRTSIEAVDVVDDREVPVPEPARETIEPPRLCLVVLRWKNAGADDEDRFAFRSPWVAWQAARGLLAARR
jgi:hypothetical protein